MPAETLFTAARRAVRDFNIDMNKGGIMTVRTEQSMQLLVQQLDQEERRLRAVQDPTVIGEEE